MIKCTKQDCKIDNVVYTCPVCHKDIALGSGKRFIRDLCCMECLDKMQVMEG